MIYVTDGKRIWQMRGEMGSGIYDGDGGWPDAFKT
jgi:hypothetical protein